MKKIPTEKYVRTYTQMMEAEEWEMETKLLFVGIWMDEEKEQKQQFFDSDYN